MSLLISAGNFHSGEVSWCGESSVFLPTRRERERGKLEGEGGELGKLKKCQYIKVMSGGEVNEPWTAGTIKTDKESKSE